METPCQVFCCSYAFRKWRHNLQLLLYCGESQYPTELCQATMGNFPVGREPYFPPGTSLTR